MTEVAVDAGITNLRQVGKEFILSDFDKHVGPYEVDPTIQGHEKTSSVLLGVKMFDGRRGMLKIHSATAIANEKFETEASILKSISQLTPYVPQLYDKTDIELERKGVKKLYPALIMEYIEGRKLNDVIAQHGSLGIPTTIALLSTVAQATDAMHEAGYAHMDIKSSNIIWRDGSTDGILMDFETTRDIGERIGESVGSQGFMGPDHLKTDTSIEPTLDVWQIAAVAYNALTGSTVMPPNVLDPVLFYSKEDYEEHIGKKLLDLPPSVRKVFSKALAYDSKQGYATATSFVESLKKAYQGKESFLYSGRHRMKKPEGKQRKTE